MSCRQTDRSRAAWLLAALALLLLSAPSRGAQPPGEKLPVPDLPAQAQALARVRDSFKLKYSTATTADAQKALAQELFQQAKKTVGDSATQYVLLKETEHLATKAKHAELALRSIEECGAKFAVNALELKVKAVTAIGKPPWPREDRAVLVGAILAVMEDAAAGDSYDVAGQLGALAVEIARKAKDPASAKQIMARTKELSGLKRFYAEAQDAAAALEKDPLDPAANLTVGKYRCFVHGQWTRGISMLALGSDATLQDLAVKQLKAVSGADAQLALGDAWWELAEREAGAVKDNLQSQAATWYQRVVPGLAGSKKEQVENRLKAVQQLAEAKALQIAKRTAAAGTEKTPPAAGARKIVVYPGVGIDAVRFGDGGDRIRAVFGEPDQVRTYPTGTNMFAYRALAVDFTTHGERQIVTEIHCNPGFKGATIHGIALGDSIDRIVQVSGGALKTVEASRDETHNSAFGGDRVLYKEMVDGRIDRLKFADSTHGIHYWCDVAGRLTQIIVYPGHR
jgi:hypothetical protein